MEKPLLTRKRILLAFVLAAIADIMQFPITVSEATGVFSLPGELADLFVDCVLMAATTMLLGFHWMLLPTLFLEIVPGLDLLPTWTACVAYVVWLRKKEQAHPQPRNRVIDIREVKVSTPQPPGVLPGGRGATLEKEAKSQQDDWRERQ